MGGSSSKAPVTADKVNQVIEESSGTHFLEIHLPSVGFSGAVLLFFILLFCLVLAMVKSCRRNQRPPTYSMAPPIFQPQQAMMPHDWMLPQLQHGFAPMGMIPTARNYLHALEAGIHLPHPAPRFSASLSMDRFQEVQEEGAAPPSGRHQRPTGPAPTPPERVSSQQPTSHSALAGRFASTDDNTRD